MPNMKSLVLVIILGLIPLAIYNCTPQRDQAPAVSLPLQMTAEQYLKQGITLSENNQYEQAITILTKAIELDPIFAKSYFYRGIAYKQNQQTELALADLSKAIGLDPSDARAYYERSTLYPSEGQWSKAIWDCNRAIELDPEYWEAYYIRGLAYMHVRQYGHALSDLGFGSEAEIAKDKLKSINAVADLVVPPGKLTLMSGRCRSDRAEIRGSDVSAAVTDYSINLEVQFLVSPGEYSILVDNIEVSPNLTPGKSQLDLQRTFNNLGFETIAIDIHSSSPAPYPLSCSINYKWDKDSEYNTSNKISILSYTR